MHQIFLGDITQRELHAIVGMNGLVFYLRVHTDPYEEKEVTKREGMRKGSVWRMVPWSGLVGTSSAARGLVCSLCLGPLWVDSDLIL